MARAAASGGVRRTLVGLVEAALVPHDLSDGLDGATYFSLDPRVLSMLVALAATATKERTLQATLPRATSAFPEPEGADYSSGVAMFISNRGGRLRPYPNFVDQDSKGGSGDDAKTDCGKPGWTKAQHKSCQWSGDGNIMFHCIHSGVPLGTSFLDIPEGPSSATAAFYCYFPEIALQDDIEMRVVCDTPCKHAEFTGNRLPRFFSSWKFCCDRFHLPPHKCKVTQQPN